MSVGMLQAWAGCPQESPWHRAVCARCWPCGALGKVGVLKGLDIVLDYFCPYSEFLLFSSGKDPAGDNRTFMAAGNAK